MFARLGIDCFAALFSLAAQRVCLAPSDRPVIAHSLPSNDSDRAAKQSELARDLTRRDAALQKRVQSCASELRRVGGRGMGDGVRELVVGSWQCGTAAIGGAKRSGGRPSP